MKRILTLAIAATMMVACSKDATEDFIGGTSDNKAASSLLQVRTRAGGGDGATVSYPVQVYVFQGEECKAVQTIGDEGQTLNIALVEGTYSVYAVGGASSTGYTLPTKDDATTTTALTLKAGQTLTDLMAATASVTLIDGGTNTVTLGMERKTMLIQDITINKIPTAATAVSVTIAPLWQNVTIGGTFSGTTGSNTIALARQDDNRTWKLPAPQGEGSGAVFLLPPSSQPATVSVNITTAANETTLTVNVIGRLDTTTAPQLEEELSDKLDGITDLILDCAELEYVSSAGLRVILGLHKLMMAKGSMKLVNVNSAVMEIFEITAFDGILNIE